MSTEIEYFGAAELSALYGSGELSPIAAVRAALAAIAAHDGELNAFRLVDEESALGAAAESERRWQAKSPLSPLDGVPLSIKDLLLTRGWPTLRGSKLIDPDGPWDEDAPGVARLREAGAVILGKTNTAEFGWKGATDSPLAGITRNPWNPKLTPGGSSGGAAAALASGMGALALCTDGGGSIRNPAGFTNLYGLKPSFGRVPAYPPNPIGTLANVGPMARSVGDLALMMNVIARPDARDWLSLPYDGTDYLAELEGGVEDLRIAYSANLGFAAVDDDISRLIGAAAQLFSDLGARVEAVDPPLGDCTQIFETHWHVGVASAFEGLPDEKLELLDPGLDRFVLAGREISLMAYVVAQNARTALGQAMRGFHEQYDLLILPTTAVTAFPVERRAPPGIGEDDWAAWSPFS
ncbi:MAG: amidase, partial [Alphaproteobacteria bacterium]|nr:amidase [Alphaproteobacteria bacterium]